MALSRIPETNRKPSQCSRSEAAGIPVRVEHARRFASSALRRQVRIGHARRFASSALRRQEQKKACPEGHASIVTFQQCSVRSNRNESDFFNHFLSVFGQVDSAELVERGAQFRIGVGVHEQRACNRIVTGLYGFC